MHTETSIYLIVSICAEKFARLNNLFSECLESIGYSFSNNRLL